MGREWPKQEGGIFRLKKLSKSTGSVMVGYCQLREWMAPGRLTPEANQIARAELWQMWAWLMWVSLMRADHGSVRRLCLRNDSIASEGYDLARDLPDRPCGPYGPEPRYWWLLCSLVPPRLDVDGTLHLYGDSTTILQSDKGHKYPGAEVLKEHHGWCASEARKARAPCAPKCNVVSHEEGGARLTGVLGAMRNEVKMGPKVDDGLHRGTHPRAIPIVFYGGNEYWHTIDPAAFPLCLPVSRSGNDEEDVDTRLQLPKVQAERVASDDNDVYPIRSIRAALDNIGVATHEASQFYVTMRENRVKERHDGMHVDDWHSKASWESKDEFVRELCVLVFANSLQIPVSQLDQLRRVEPRSEGELRPYDRAYSIR